jgi:hypothetical protein
VKFAVYSTKGVRGVFTALDDRGRVVRRVLGGLDFRDLYKSLPPSSRRRKTTPSHTIYITGLPWAVHVGAPVHTSNGFSTSSSSPS